MPGVFNPQGKKVILSLSGGGMRGLISLAMLAELERYSGRPIYEQVDMIAGTSTGALMAAGFAVGMSAERILNEIYREALPRAFGRRGLGFWLRFLLRGTRHMYSLEPFARILSPYVANPARRRYRSADLAADHDRHAHRQHLLHRFARAGARALRQLALSGGRWRPARRHPSSSRRCAATSSMAASACISTPAYPRPSKRWNTWAPPRAFKMARSS